MYLLYIMPNEPNTKKYLGGDLSSAGHLYPICNDFFPALKRKAKTIS